MTEVVVETGYKPREQQRKIHDAVESHRFVVVVAHRRMGKTVAALNQLIHSALQCDKPDPRFAYIAPTYGQAKRVAWDYLVNFTRPLDAAHNISELKVDFYGRRIQLYGSDNPDSLRGQYFDGVILDEIGDQNPKIWNEIVRPALADRLGWALFLGTPKGANHFKDFRDRAEKEPGWSLLGVTTSTRKSSSAPLIHQLKVRIMLRSLANLRRRDLRSSPKTTYVRPIRLGTWASETLRQSGYVKLRGRRGGSLTSTRTTGSVWTLTLSGFVIVATLRLNTSSRTTLKFGSSVQVKVARKRYRTWGFLLRCVLGSPWTTAYKRSEGYYQTATFTPRPSKD